MTRLARRLCGEREPECVQRQPARTIRRSAASRPGQADEAHAHVGQKRPTRCFRCSKNHVKACRSLTGSRRSRYGSRARGRAPARAFEWAIVPAWLSDAKTLRQPVERPVAFGLLAVGRRSAQHALEGRDHERGPDRGRIARRRPPGRSPPRSRRPGSATIPLLVRARACWGTIVSSRR